MTKPVTSTSIATNGADALAGSKPTRCRMKGSIEPVSEPNGYGRFDPPTLQALRAAQVWQRLLARQSQHWPCQRFQRAILNSKQRSSFDFSSGAFFHCGLRVSILDANLCCACRGCNCH